MMMMSLATLLLRACDMFTNVARCPLSVSECLFSVSQNSYSRLAWIWPITLKREGEVTHSYAELLSI